METLIGNVHIADKEGLRLGSVLIRDGVIAALAYGKSGHVAASEIDRKIDFDGSGGILAPGFIDLHCHGGNGSDVNDATDEALEIVGQYHLLNGTTS